VLWITVVVRWVVFVVVTGRRVVVYFVLVDLLVVVQLECEPPAARAFFEQ
jgi:hypothetical protein